MGDAFYAFQLYRPELDADCVHHRDGRNRFCVLVAASPAIFAGVQMYRIRFTMLVAALTAATWSSCEAVGSFRRPEPRPLVTAGVAPSISAPNLNTHDLLGGCGGRGRIRDPQTHRCLGPADIR
jgi:hypothetical protein